MPFDAGAAVGKMKLDTTNWDAGVKNVQKSSGMVGGFTKVMKAGFAGLAVGIGAATTALVSQIKHADTWQKEFANVSTLVDTSQVNMQAMAKELILLDGRLGDTTDLTKGLYQAISASVDPAKAVQFVGEAAKFAKAALTDTNTAVDVITTGLNAYGLEAEKATGISDQLFSVIKLGKTSGAELAATIGDSIPLAANMGISFDELGASIAVMTRQGVKAANATTQFNAVTNAFLKPSKKMQEVLAGIGYESGAAAIEQLGFKGALDEVIKAGGGTKDELAAMFRNTRALRGVMALTGEGAKDFGSILDEITNSAGATDEAFQKQDLTFDTLKNTMGDVGLIVGNIGKKFANELAVGANKAANSMLQFLMSSQGAQIVSEIIAQVTAGFEALKKIIQPITDALFPTLKELWEDAQKALAKLGGGLGDASGAFNIFGYFSQLAASAIRVFGVVIGGVIEAVVNLIEAIKASGGIIGKFFDFLIGKAKWKDVTNQVKLAGDAFAKFGSGILDTVDDAFDAVFDEAENFSEKVKNTAHDIEIAYTTSYKNTKTNILNTWDELITGQENFAKKIIEGAENLSLELQKIDEETGNSNLKLLEVFTESTKNRYKRWEGARKRFVDHEIAAMEEVARKQQEIANTIKSGVTSTMEALGKMIIGDLKNKKEAAKEFEVASAAAWEKYTEDQKNALITSEDAWKTYQDTLADAQMKLNEANKAAWEGFKKAGLGAIASVVRAFGEQWAVQAAAEWAAVFGGNLLRASAATGYTAASAGAFAAAGVIKSLRGGGYASGLAWVGENGPELVNFGGQPSRVYNNYDSRKMMGGQTININMTGGQEQDANMLSFILGRTVQAQMRGI